MKTQRRHELQTNVLADYLGDLQRRRPAAMILGCTHYPLLKPAIARFMGADTVIVDSADALAAAAALDSDTSRGVTGRPGGAPGRAGSDDLFAGK